MADRIELQAEKRAETGTKIARNLRSAGFLPAVIYGKDFDPIPLKVDCKKFGAVYKEAGSSTMIDLKVGDEKFPAIIQEVSESPVSGEYLHADFYKVRLDQKITAHVHLNFVGESSAVKELGGILARNINEVEVFALPQDLPPFIDVDVTALQAIGDSILIRDLKIPTGIEVEAEDNEIVATVVAPEEEEIPVETSVEDVEVITKEEAAEEEAEEAKPEE